MRHIISGVAVLATVLVLSSSTGAQSPRPKLEVFNSFKSFEETGDLMGMEVILVRTKTGACVSYQEAEGGPGQSRILSADIRGDSLFFTIPPDSAYQLHVARGATDTIWTETAPASHFRGRISPAGLTVQIDDRQSDSGWLPRRSRAYFAASARKLSNELVQSTGGQSGRARPPRPRC